MTPSQKALWAFFPAWVFWISLTSHLGFYYVRDKSPPPLGWRDVRMSFFFGLAWVVLDFAMNVTLGIPHMGWYTLLVHEAMTLVSVTKHYLRKRKK